jgi:hypothetical protein
VWQPGISPEEQERYKGSEQCKLWPIFESFNDWTVVSLKAGMDANEEQIEETQQVVLNGFASMIATTIEIG